MTDAFTSSKRRREWERNPNKSRANLSGRKSANGNRWNGISSRRKRSFPFRGRVCRAGFLCETARGDFRFGDSIKKRKRQSRAPLRALERTRAYTERLISLEL